MCTMIAQQIQVDGSGKGSSGWFDLRQANVSYDHPYHVPLEHALNIDFVDMARGPSCTRGRRTGRRLGVCAGGDDFGCAGAG